MMSRRTALATAAAVVLTVTTASLAVAANLGTLSDEEPVGQLAPVTATTADAVPVVPTDAPTVYVDEQGNVLPFVPAPSGQAPGADTDDDAFDDDDHDDHDDGDDEHEDEHDEDDGDDEHEGRDDDD